MANVNEVIQKEENSTAVAEKPESKSPDDRDGHAVAVKQGDGDGGFGCAVGQDRGGVGHDGGVPGIGGDGGEVDGRSTGHDAVIGVCGGVGNGLHVGIGDGESHLTVGVGGAGGGVGSDVGGTGLGQGNRVTGHWGATAVQQRHGDGGCRGSVG